VIGHLFHPFFGKPAVEVARMIQCTTHATSFDSAYESERHSQWVGPKIRQLVSLANGEPHSQYP